MQVNKNLIEKATEANRRLPYNTLVYYLRNEDRTPYGVVVAVMTNKGPRIGYHECRNKETLNKQVGRYIATQRALAYDYPQTPGYNKMRERVDRYMGKNSEPSTCSMGMR